MNRIALGVAGLVAAVALVLACGSDDGPGDDAFPSCAPLTLTSPGPFTMPIDSVQNGPLPFQKWTGTLVMSSLPTGVGYDPDAGTYLGVPNLVGSSPVQAYTELPNGCYSDPAKYTINVVDAPANCTDDTSCTDPALPKCNTRMHCVPSTAP